VVASNIVVYCDVLTSVIHVAVPTPPPVGCTILHSNPPAPVSSTHRVLFIILVSSRSQLGLGLGLLQDGLHLGSLHDVALDLELAGHEQALGVGLAADEAGEVGIGQGEGDCVFFEID
jgi:hypothetical protein